MIKDMPLLVFGGSFLDSFVKLSLILILIGKHNFYSNKRFWISSLILSIYVTFSYMITDSGIRTILLFIITILTTCINVRISFKEINKVIITTFIAWVAMALLDVLCNIFVTGILRIDMNEYRNNIYLVYSINSIILFALVLLFNFKTTRKFVSKLLDFEFNPSNYYYSLIIFVSVILFSIVFYLCIFKVSTIIILVMVLVMVITYTIVTLMTIRVSNQKNKIKTEYSILLTNLSEYENLLDRQRILNHENKNQLLVIKGMITKGEDAIKYINSLVQAQYKDSDDLIMTTNRIPSGGLKGLVYYKMLVMKDKNISVNLEVNHNISNVNFESLSTKDNQELCKILGVFLDNAIEEVENLQNKNINIIFEKNEEKLIIKIMNNFGCSNINNIGNKGYTSKGNGHGYGLMLVKNIVENNKRFEHKTEINGKTFSQIVILKLKND